MNRNTERKRDEVAMRRNNPKNEPVGPYTGRCAKCGSKNLWDDETAYGCKDCGEVVCHG